MIGSRGNSLWKLTRDNRMLMCVLYRGIDKPLALRITIDGTEIAARACGSRLEADSYAAFLFERLTEAGWVVRSGITHSVIH